MKTAERHRLKDNEVAEGLAFATDYWEGNRKTILQALGVVAVVALIAGAWWLYRHNQLENASALYAAARITAIAPVAPPPTAAAPGQPAPVVPKDAFPTEAARRDAAITKYEAAANAYPSTGPGLAARLEAASLLGEAGKLAEAQKQLEEVVRLDGGGFYGRMAKLGLATMQIDAGQTAPAITTLTELSQRTDLEIPVDGVLMQLGRAYEKAGKPADAVRTFTRIGDEFPESPYASDARAEAERLKAKS
jgi:predicted negative regulator of RcsB-dependent stress response